MKRRHVNAGATAEILTLARIIEIGWIGSLPFGAKAGYDIVADTGSRLVRIQVKTIYLGATDNGTRWVMDFLKPKGSGKRGRKYSSQDCDYIVGFCPEKNRCFVFPIEECNQRRQATFYFDSPPPTMARNHNWVLKFEDAWPVS